MENNKVILNDYILDYYSINTLVIGSGVASLNAAINLHSMGQKSILIATTGWGSGTSNNAGSDKQTFYKLSLSGDEPDSVMNMAEDLFNGKCMHGDIALCEAQGSVHAFMNLVHLGVPFPQNRYGAWVGYKTDHDPRARATSAGPYTSKKMFETLAAEVKRRKIRIIDKLQVIALITGGKKNDKKVTGALAINMKEKDHLKAFVLINSVNIIIGTGGPGGIYENSVYPVSQTGYSGMAYEAGATGHNLTESQFGIASIKFRWNLSGSYQQVIPRYISTDKTGNDEKEFLNEFFPDMTTLTRAIFLKGYQWPFDPRKVEGKGSSLIDLLVHREKSELNRRVFIDYTRNPSGIKGQKFSFKVLDHEVFSYLEKSGALQDTPYKRLEAMNKPAIDLYLDHNIDLKKDPVEIAVCAQHNNGGLKGNIWWESDLRHLFPVGEVNGSHGVYRPGGSALNSGQVGSYRAAYFISRRYCQEPSEFNIFIYNAKKQVSKKLKLASAWMTSDASINNSELLAEIRHRMSDYGGIIRNKEKIFLALKEAEAQLKTVDKKIGASSVKKLAEAFLITDQCLTHYLYLEAIKTYLDEGGRSRGSFLVTDIKGIQPEVNLDDKWRFTICNYDRVIEKNIIEIRLNNKKAEKNIVKVRNIPKQELWFEKVWKDNREDNLIET
jgi:succinate dehydrogenase/fumarate reductase flavoprotein subunit